MRALCGNNVGQELPDPSLGFRTLIEDACAYLFVDVSGREVRLEPTLWIFVFIIVRQTELLLHLVIFVVAGIDDYGRVVT